MIPSVASLWTMALGEVPFGMSMYCPFLVWATGLCRLEDVQVHTPATARIPTRITSSKIRFMFLGKVLAVSIRIDANSILIRDDKVAQDRCRCLAVNKCRDFFRRHTFGF